MNNSSQHNSFQSRKLRSCNNATILAEEKKDFIARQRAMHVERDIVLPTPYVCPFVHRSNCV